MPVFSKKEQKEIQKNRGSKDVQSRWTMPDGRHVLNKKEVS